MEGNNARIGIAGILLTAHLLFGCPQFLHMDCWWVALSHHFFHANIFHLAVNCLSLWALFRKDVRYGIDSLVAAYIIGTLSWFATSADAVGFSNIIFALVGLRTPSLKSEWWKHPSVVTFLVITMVLAFLPQVSAVTHMVSFTLGCIAAGAQRIINRVSSDFRRATYNR